MKGDLWGQACFYIYYIAFSLHNEAIILDIMDISAPFTDKDAGVPAVQATFNTQVPQVTC